MNDTLKKLEKDCELATGFSAGMLRGMSITDARKIGELIRGCGRLKSVPFEDTEKINKQLDGALRR